MTATKIQPGDDTHLTLLMARHSLNLVTGADRAALLAYGRDVFAAGQAGAAPAAVAGVARAGWRLVPATPTRDWIAAVADGVYEYCDCASLIADILSRAPAAPALEAPAAPPPRTTGYIAPKGRYVPPVLFDPYTGEPRDARDIASDPQGVLIVPPGAAIQRVREG